MFKRYAMLIMTAILLLGCLVLWNVTWAAPVQTLITISPPMVSGIQSFYSATLIVDDTLMFPSTNGGVFYEQGGVKYVVPLDGSCTQMVKDSYICTVRDDYHGVGFVLTMDVSSRQGKIWSTKGVFSDSDFHDLVLTDAALPLKAPQ